MTNPFINLLTALAGVPSLPGARCKGSADLFDPAADHEGRPTVNARQSRAQALCAGCPALADCERWLFGLPKTAWPRGVVAGRIIIGYAGQPKFQKHQPAQSNS